MSYNSSFFSWSIIKKKKTQSFLINLDQDETVGLLIFQSAFCKIMRLFINIQEAREGS